jgi:hypothetical protein
MAQMISLAEARDYPLSTGGTVDLAALVADGLPRGWVQNSGKMPVIGTAVRVNALGRWRQGAVVKLTPTRVHVALTTQGAVKAAGLGPRGQVRVQIVTVDPNYVYVKIDLDGAHAEALIDNAERTATMIMDEAHAEALIDNAEWDGEAQLTHSKTVVTGADEDDEPVECGNCGGPMASDGFCVDDTCGDIPAEEVSQPPRKLPETTGSAVVRLLERVYARIRAEHPDLPEMVIVTGAGIGGGNSKWGHFRPDGWAAGDGRMHEMFMAGETLAKGARQVLQTMLHESAHTLAQVRELKDTSRQGRWHNATFRKLAEEMGLEHRGSQADKTHGFSFVTLPEATADRYADLLAELDAEIHLTVKLPVWLGGDETEGGESIGKAPKTGEGKQTGGKRATCGCAEPNIIRLSQKVLDLGVVRCDSCGDLFTAS